MICMAINLSVAWLFIQNMSLMKIIFYPLANPFIAAASFFDNLEHPSLGRFLNFISDLK